MFWKGTSLGYLSVALLAGRGPRPLILAHGTVGRNKFFAACSRGSGCSIRSGVGTSGRFGSGHCRSAWPPHTSGRRAGASDARWRKLRVCRGTAQSQLVSATRWSRVLLNHRPQTRMVPYTQGVFVGVGRQPQQRHEARPQQDIRIRDPSGFGTRRASRAWRLGRRRTRPQIRPKNLLLGDPQCFSKRTLLRERGGAASSESMARSAAKPPPASLQWRESHPAESRP